jgi:hypothetical protein
MIIDQRYVDHVLRDLTKRLLLNHRLASKPRPNAFKQASTTRWPQPSPTQ